MRISQYEKIKILFPSRSMPCRRCAKAPATSAGAYKRDGDWFVCPSETAPAISGRTAYKVIWRCHTCGQFSHPRYTLPVDFSGGKGVKYQDYSLDEAFIQEAEETRAQKIDERKAKGTYYE